MDTERIVDHMISKPQKSLIKKLKKNYFGITVPILIFLIFTSLVACRAFVKAKVAGDFWGGTAGKFAGDAVGSLDAITGGMAKGAEAGKQQGLSAEDTEVRIGNEIKNTGKLDVLIAESQFTNTYKEGQDYKALFAHQVDVTFSDDLKAAIVEHDETNIKIILPEPEAECIINENESKKLAEWQKYLWSGSAESGYIAYINSMAQIQEKSVSEIKNYDDLMMQAKEAAKIQVENLVNSIRVQGKTIQIIFQGEEE